MASAVIEKPTKPIYQATANKSNPKTWNDQWQRVRVRFDGITDLMWSCFRQEDIKGLQSKGRKSMSSDERNDHEIAESFLSKDEKGNPICPRDSLMQGMINAGSHYQIGRTKLSTAKTSRVPSLMRIVESEIPIKAANPWYPDKRTVTNKIGERVLKIRPRWSMPWSIEFTLEYDGSEISERDIREFFCRMGRYEGLGSFRPGRRGTYGVFMIGEFTPCNAR